MPSNTNKEKSVKTAVNLRNKANTMYMPLEAVQHAKFVY